jgi:isopentenyl diphosphate isomerase/L-lactate dehydrogenase-like FMN-dependent dehydrogenase
MDGGYTVRVITIDSTVIGHRERELRDGMEQLLRGNIWSKIPFAPQVLARRSWLTRFLLDGGLPDMPNIVSAETGVLRVRDAHTAMKREVFSWDDMQWIRALWKGPIVIKGVLSADDAKRSLDHGAAAVVVSNHGGRQLDGVPASLQVLPEVVAAVKDQAEVMMDSGIRRGSDIAKAMCMGRGLSFVDVPLLTDSLPVAKRALPGRSRCFALTWSDVSNCWDVGPLTL